MNTVQISGTIAGKPTDLGDGTSLAILKTSDPNGSDKTEQFTLHLISPPKEDLDGREVIVRGALSCPPHTSNCVLISVQKIIHTSKPKSP